MEASDVERICKAFIRLISSEKVENRQRSISRQGRDKSECQSNKTICSTKTAKTNTQGATR